MAIDLATITDVVNLMANARRLGAATHGAIATLIGSHADQVPAGSAGAIERRFGSFRWARSSTRLIVS